MTRVNGFGLFYQDDDFSDPWRPTEAVFMLHGFSRNGNFWRAWVPTLSRHYRVIRADIRGCGRSEDPGPHALFDPEAVVSDCIGLLDALGIDKVHFVGEAGGGALGCVIAARHPDRILTLTLVGAPTRPAQGDPKALSSGLASPEVAIRTLGLKEWWLRPPRMVPGAVESPEQADYLSDEIARTPTHWAIAMLAGMARLDTSPLLPMIKAPTLLLSPTRAFTGQVTLEQQAEMKRLIPDAQQRLYDAVPQAMYYLRADELARDTLGFLRSHPRSDLS